MLSFTTGELGGVPDVENMNDVHNDPAIFDEAPNLSQLIIILRVIFLNCLDVNYSLVCSNILLLRKQNA